MPSARNEAHFHRGYQSALLDLATALTNEGEDGVWRWLYNNTDSAKVRQGLERMAPEHPNDVEVPG